MIDSCYVGDTRHGMRAMIAVGVRAQTCVTSPPYWGLRDYGHAEQIGLEPTIAEYVSTMVDVFRMVRGVLADDGTLWLNLGDSYAGSWGAQSRENGNDAGSTLQGGSMLSARQILAHPKGTHTGSLKNTPGLKPKDLCGIPWRVAFALQADGWYLRSDIIWAKRNPMPESVTDRPTKAHEYLFLLSKRERYYYDAEAIKEESVTDDPRRPYGSPGADALDPRGKQGEGNVRRGGFNGKTNDLPGREAFRAFTETRNRRTVWTIATEPYADAHFATFPTALVEPCILAGSRVGDVVLDPFMGSGTVAQVAQSLGRRWVGCELNPEYVAMQKQRAAQTGLELQHAR